MPKLDDCKSIIYDLQKRHETKDGSQAEGVSGTEEPPGVQETVEPGADTEQNGEVEADVDAEGEAEAEADEEDLEDTQGLDKATSPPPQTPH